MSGTSKKILIVDDDKFLLDMYSVKFREAGFEVALCPSATEALKKATEEPAPDAVLLDVVMPEMNGLELLSKLRTVDNLKNTAFIVLSNQGQAEDINEAKKLGVDGYIVKASTIPSEVLDKVKEILSRKHA